MVHETSELLVEVLNLSEAKQLNGPEPRTRANCALSERYNPSYHISAVSVWYAVF